MMMVHDKEEKHPQEMGNIELLEKYSHYTSMGFRLGEQQEYLFLLRKEVFARMNEGDHKKVERAIEMFREMQMRSEPERQADASDFGRGMDEGMVLGYKYAANYLEMKFFPDGIRYCNRCNNKVIKSDLKEYVYQCLECDEDLYGIETYVKE